MVRNFAIICRSTLDRLLRKADDDDRTSTPKEMAKHIADIKQLNPGLEVAIKNWDNHASEPDKNDQKNYTKVTDSIYIARTQTGFNNCLKDFFDEADKSFFSRVQSFPKKYPCLISLSYGYLGYLYPHVTSVHLNDLIESIGSTEWSRVDGTSTQVSQ